VETKDGQFFERHTAPLRTEAGRYLGRVWFFRDITLRRQAEAEIRHTTRHDGLTGLANRRVFMEEVQKVINRVGRGEKRFAVLYMDLDHFKDVNDTLGHPMGDALLCAVAERLELRGRIRGDYNGPRRAGRCGEFGG
jgi:GGDEF domain-containing protein